MKKLFFIPLLIGISMIIGTMFFATQNVLVFADIPTFAITAGLSFILILSQYSPAEIGRAFKYSVLKTEFDETEIRKGILFFATFNRLLILSAVMATFIGIIVILANPENYKKIGTMVSVCLISVLYVVFIQIIVVIPFKGALEKRIISKS